MSYVPRSGKGELNKIRVKNIVKEERIKSERIRKRERQTETQKESKKEIKKETKKK